MGKNIKEIQAESLRLVMQAKYKEAIELLIPIADDDPDIQFQIASYYNDANNPDQDLETGSEWLQKAYDGGNALAQFIVYAASNEDSDVADFAEFAQKYGMAQAGDAEAQCYLGKCYYEGEVLPWDEESAFAWYRKSAESGYAPAQYALGSCYEYGRGVDEDETSAYEWYKKGAATGDADCLCALGSCYYYGTGIEEDQAEAVELFAKSAEQDHAEGLCMLAGCYEYGHGVEKDLNKAIELYRRSAAKGYEEAENALARLVKND